MRISGAEPLSVILRQTKHFKMLKNKETSIKMYTPF